MRGELVRVLTASLLAGAAFVVVPASAAGQPTAGCAATERVVTPQRAAFGGVVTVPVVFHVVHKADGTGDLPQAAVDAQVARLNKDFSGQEAPGVAADTGFRFELAATRRWQNDDWFDRAVQEEVHMPMRAATRQGGKNTLNIWSVKVPYEGWSDFAWDAERLKATDGMLLNWTTLPGGSHPKHDEGKTASHETGHWLGLWHTFEFLCDQEGDLVTDTPAHSANFDCEEDDSCLEQPGTDPIHNYMNYTGDACRNQFTAGQGARAREHWFAYRA